MEEAGCALCGNKAGSRPYLQTRDNGISFRYRRCNACDLVFLSPRPDAREILPYYDQKYYGAGEYKFRGWIEALRRFWAGGRATRAQRFVLKPSRALDIGCGQGSFLGLLRREGWEVQGTELNADSARRAARRGIPVSLGDIQEDQFPEGSLQLVTLWQVLEHLRNPRKVLRAVHRMLGKDGILGVSTPNIESRQARFFRERWFHLDAPRHLYLFSPGSLERLAGEEGFRSICIRHLCLEQSPYGWLQSFLNRMNSSSESSLYSLLKTPPKSLRPPKNGSLARTLGLAAPLLPLSFFLTFWEAGLGAGGSIEAYFQKET